MNIVIIGGVAFGATFATKFRRLNEDAKITIFEKSANISYANCGLPYYLSKTIPSKENLILQEPNHFAKRYKVDVNVNTWVYRVDFDTKTVYAKNKIGKEYIQKYDKLIIATGTRARSLDFLENKDNVFNLKTVEHALAIDEYLQKSKPQKAVILGSGFIGIEVAENLNKLGIKTTIVEANNQVLAPFDEEMAYYGKLALEKENIRVICNKFATDFDGRTLTLSDGTTIETDLLISSIGVIPNTDFLKETKLLMDKQGYIEVNEQFATNIKDVYAGGDIIKPLNKITKTHTLNQLANPANRQGVMLAQILNGHNLSYNKSITTSIVKIGKQSLAQCGINERNAKDLNLEYKVIVAHINNHVAYYPGADLIHFKVLINPSSGQIYGAQATSATSGVDKRIDMLAMAIKFDIKIQDLVDIETTYAPQFGSAKDPVMMLGYIGKNIVSGIEDLIQFQDLKPQHKLLFVVDENEREQIQLDNIFNIELNQLRDNLDKLDKNVHYVVVCKVGARAHNALSILRNNNFKVSNLAGGYLSINHYLDLQKSKTKDKI